MKRIFSFLTVLAAILLSAMPLMAQQNRLSPHATTSMVVDGSRVMIVYGRPYITKPGTTEVRKIWGGLVPFGKWWRLGADEATILVSQKPLVFGSTTIPAGAYSLFLLPSEDGTAKLIFNKEVGQWGEEYDASADVAQVDLKKTDLEKPVEQFTMNVGRAPGGGGVIKMAWENRVYYAAFTVQK